MKAILLAATIFSTSHVVPAEVVEVYDGDTLTVRVEIWPNTYWEGSVRIDGIDTPELGWRAECPEETALAHKGKTITQDYAADRVLIVNPKLGKYAGRVVAEVLTEDGASLGDLLIFEGAAREYHGGRREGWCPDE